MFEIQLSCEHRLVEAVPYRKSAYSAHWILLVKEYLSQKGSGLFYLIILSFQYIICLCGVQISYIFPVQDTDEKWNDSGLN